MSKDKGRRGDETKGGRKEKANIEKRKASKKKSLKDEGKTKGKSRKKKMKRKKGVRLESGGLSVEEVLRGLMCPCCSKRCPLAKPKCGKGRALAKKKAEKVA